MLSIEPVQANTNGISSHTMDLVYPNSSPPAIDINIINKSN